MNPTENIYLQLGGEKALRMLLIDVWKAV